MELEILRFLPELHDRPAFQTYEVPFREDWVLLDAMNYIKDRIDGTLSYRWTCRMGVCGSCGMMVNGIPKLTCSVFLKDYYPKEIRVEPLRGFPIQRDLVVVMDDFMNKLRSVRPWIIREKDNIKPLKEGEYPQTPAEVASYKQYSMCINCMLCYAGCPVYFQDNRFLGPAAIAISQRYNLDSRDEGQKERDKSLYSDNGVWMCTNVGECTRVCPKNVDPAGAIQRAKIPGVFNYFTDLPLPWGSKSE
jgi:fumarate reductase iron-sulfur subunit